MLLNFLLKNNYSFNAGKVDANFLRTYIHALNYFISNEGVKNCDWWGNWSCGIIVGLVEIVEIVGIVEVVGLAERKWR